MRLQSAALEAAANGIIITDEQGIIMWANPAFLELTGHSEDEVIGQNTRMLKSGKHKDQFYQALWETILAGRVWQGELFNKRKDGSLYIEEMTITPVAGSDGGISNFIAIKQDITDRIKGKERLVRSEKSQRIINYFATSLAGSNTVEEILWDITNNCISELGWEDSVIYLFNDDRTKLVQRAAYGSGKEKDYQILNPIDIPLGEGIVGTVAMTGKTELIPDVEKDFRYVVDDKARGSELAVPIIYENQVIGVIDSENSEKGFFKEYDLQILEAISSLSANKIMRTISMKKTEESEVKYRSIFESIQDIYAEVDFSSGIILEVSPSVEEFSGFKRHELIGQRFDKFASPLAPNRDLLQSFNEKNHLNDFEVTVINKLEDPMTVSFNASLLLDDAGKPSKIVGTLRNVSVRKKAELTLQDSMRMKTNFVANVSHELRTPMASILGYAGTILRDKNMKEETRTEFTKIIYEEGRRLTRLIENILDLSRMEAGTTQNPKHPCAIQDIIGEAIETQDILARKKNITIEADLAEDPPKVMAAEDDIRQMAINLLGNAIKFTESGGLVSVALRKVENSLLLEIKDTGLGIPGKDLDKVFDKFYRVYREGRVDRGTGIGLAIVKEIVVEHGGQIGVKSEVGKGTTFSITFPVTQKSGRDAR